MRAEIMSCFCGKIIIDDIRREICFDSGDCIQFKTAKQFDVAYLTLVRVISHCKKYMDEMKKKKNKDKHCELAWYAI